jgi:protein-S-isoprenylcysteine O-methyltransferase Ste14
MTMSAPGADNAGIRIFPPFIYAGAFVIGYAVHRFVPVHLWPNAVPAAARVVAWGLLGAWLGLGGSAVFLFRRAGTTPNPTKPTTAIVMHGPYRFTRNPMYLGLIALYLGLVVFLNSLWPLVLLPAVVVMVQRHVIAREEAYLAAKFGDAYRAYTERVRRWL